MKDIKVTLTPVEETAYTFVCLTEEGIALTGSLQRRESDSQAWVIEYDNVQGLMNRAEWDRQKYDIHVFSALSRIVADQNREAALGTR